MSAGLRRAGSSRISRSAVAQYTRSRFASPTRFTIRARSSRSMARCAVVNAIANLPVTPLKERRQIEQRCREDLALDQLQSCSIEQLHAIRKAESKYEDWEADRPRPPIFRLGGLHPRVPHSAAVSTPVQEAVAMAQSSQSATTCGTATSMSRTNTCRRRRRPNDWHRTNWSTLFCRRQT